MNKNFVDKLVPAYKGDEPYIFVSYSHQDSSFVFPELTWLRDQGFNVWYDEGIEAGSEWREEIANAIKNARLVLFFVSKRSAQSENCRKEISLADKQQIPIIAIHFEPTELPGSLDLTLSDRQAILRYEISDREYQEKLQPRILSYLGQPIVPLKAITRIKFRYKAVALTVGFLGILSILWSVNESRLWLTEIAYDLVIRGATLISPYALAMEQGIAVLPFANMSNDPDNEYFSDGISEEIINALVKTNSMNVIARTSAFAFKGKNQDIREIGRILGVTHILEGSVRKANNRVRITVQLIDTITGAHLWSETYDRELLDIFAIQYEIATTVVNQIGIELTAGAQPEFRPTGSDVYELYLQATHLVNSDNPADLEKAITLFEQAIALDRNHVDSWVGLGMTYGRFTTSYRGHRFPDEVQPMAINAFRTALEIDPANTRAMGMLGWLLAMQEFKWKDGVALMKKSVALNPNDGLVQALYGWLLFHTGQPEAVSVIEKAYRLDPLDPDVIFIKSALLTWLGQRLDAMTLQATLLLHDQEGYRSNVLVALAFAYNRPILAEERLVRARKVAGANEPFIKLLETMIALGRGDTKRFEELRAEVFDLAQHTPLQFLGNIPWTKDQIVDMEHQGKPSTGRFISRDISAKTVAYV